MTVLSKETVKLYNKWSTEVDFGSGGKHGAKIEMSKSGNDINGEMELTSGTHQGNKYPIKGRFNADILTFYFYPENPLSANQGSATFKRLKEGELLKGYFAYYGQEPNPINTVECELRPVK